MNEELDYLLWRIETEKVYKEGGRTTKELESLPYKKKAWRRSRLVRISLIPRALVLGAMDAVPNTDGTYPMPKGIGVVARKMMLMARRFTEESVMMVSTVSLLKGIKEWVNEIQEFLDWKGIENPLDLGSVLYNTACHIETETGWGYRKRSLNEIDERQDWQQIKLIHVSLVPQALAAGTMMETEAKNAQSGQPDNWPLPPYANNVIKWVNWNLKQLEGKYASPEILRISPFLLQELMKKWLLANPYYVVWGKMGKESLDLDTLIFRSIRWLNGEVNSLMAMLSKEAETAKPKSDSEDDFDTDGDDLLEQLHIR